MSLWNKFGVMGTTLKRVFDVSLSRDVQYEMDNAVRQYLIEKNRATHYEAQAQKWLALAKRHQQFLSSTAQSDVQRIIELENAGEGL